MAVKRFDPDMLQKFLSDNYHRLAYDTWASMEPSFFYINIPKTGCTKIKKMLQCLCGLPVPEGVSPIHKRGSGLFVKSFCDFNLNEQLYLLNAKEVNRICFVRNPYTRLLSGYWNKVAGSKKYGNLTESILESISTDDLQRVPSFMEFLQYIFRSNKNHLDIHFRSQSKISHFDQINYNCIGHFENFQEDLVRVFKKLGAKQEILNSVDTIENQSTSNTTLSSPLLNHLVQTEIGDHFYNYFKEDFTNFNYAKY